MDTKRFLEYCSNTVRLFAEAPKVAVLLALSIIAILAALNPALAKSNLTEAGLPSDGWVYVGYLKESGGFTAGPRVDPKRTKIEGQRVTALRLRSAAPVVQNGDDCTSTKLEDVQPPTKRDREALNLLLAPNPTTPFEIVDTARCPSRSGGQWVYAKVKIQPSNVRFAKLESLQKR
ncbi:MAG: hypothetical protein JNM79_22160 [Burkholderiales bacterium]|nr:hypothetical protein [Burkholderiales bacterium]